MPEISGFVVFKEMRDNQSFNIEEAILTAHKLYIKHPPEKVFQLIAKDNTSSEATRKLSVFVEDSPCLRLHMEKLYLTNARLSSKKETTVSKVTQSRPYMMSAMVLMTVLYSANQMWKGVPINQL